MRKLLLSGLVACGGATSFAGGYGLKYVATGWDLGRVTPAQVLKMMPKFERTAFSGLSVGCSARQDGVTLDAGYAFSDPAWRFETFAPLLDTYRAINARGKLTDNFLAAGLSARKTEGERATCGGRIRLDDDAAWARVANNYGVLAKVAKAGGFRGIQLDNEDYHGLRQFEYRPEDGDYETAARRMRARGREVFAAVFREFPDVRLGFFWAFSNIRTQLHAADPVRAIRESGRLLPQFLNGLLDVMPPEAVVIDFDEDAYTFRAADGTFEKTFVDLMSHALVAVAPENRAKYRAQFRNSSLLYLDQYVGAKYRTRAGKRGAPNNWYRAPVNGSRAGAFFADLEAAARTADEYLGFYGERFGFIDWEHELDGAMQPWNAFLSRVTWDERLGLDTKLRLVREPQKLLQDELAAAAKDPARRNLLADLPNFGKSCPGTFVVCEDMTNRNFFAATFEAKGEATAVARWQNGTAWNWAPHGVRKVAFDEAGKAADGWTRYAALLRVPVAATRVQLQLGTNEIRRAALYRLDPPPKPPFRLAYQMDIARIGAPSAAALRERIDVLSELGFDQFQLYMECEFAYKGHETVWQDLAVLDAASLKALVRYAASKGVEMVPSQNSFAHMNKWLRVPAYRARYAECPNGAVIDTPKMKKRRPSVTFAASAPETLSFLAGLYDQLLPCFESRFFNVGCDEVYDLLDVNCRSAAKVRRDGYARAYWDHVLACRKLAYQRQRETMFWADAIFEHPELIREIPRDMVALVYGYTPGGADRFEAKCAALQADEVRFYTCPGTQGWKAKLSEAARQTLARANIREAYDAAMRYGGEGLMVCDWGDDGYPQPLSYTRPVLEYAAGLVKKERKGN